VHKRIIDIHIVVKEYFGKVTNFITPTVCQGLGRIKRNKVLDQLDRAWRSFQRFQGLHGD